MYGVLLNITISKFILFIFSFSTDIVGDFRVNSMYLWFPLDYKNLKDNFLSDPLSTKSTVYTNVNSGIATNLFNLPLYNYSDSLDYQTLQGPDPQVFYSLVNIPVSTNNNQSK